MSKRIYIYSTLASDMAYTNHKQGGADLPILLPPVHIKGGAGVANDRLVTPLGVATEITEEDLAYLEQNPVFKLHRSNGFIKVSEASGDADKVAADMDRADPSAPLVPQDFGAKEQPVGADADADDVPAKPTKGRRAS